MAEITIKRLRSSRSLRLRVYEDGRVTLTAPVQVSDRQINQFLADQKDWLAEKLSTSTAKQSSLTTNREQLFFRGQEYAFRLEVSSTKKSGVQLLDQQLIVTTPSEDHATVRQILERWFRAEATKRFTKRVPLLADLVGRDVSRVTIRDQRTRWGSCSSRNTISLNWRLIMAPDAVSDYVIYHELAHLTHMNHSSRFWQLVSEYVPNYKTAEAWLKTHHRLLRF